MWEEFKQNYEEYLPCKPKTSQTSKKKVHIYKLFIFSIVSRASQSQNNDSDDSESLSSSSEEEEFADELDRYLSSGHIKGVEDPIMWWHENQANYPCLSCMAKRIFLVSWVSFFFF